MASTAFITSAQPYLVPGYTGHCPQYRFRCGETYGGITHKLLLDPSINHAETLVLSNRVTDDYQVQRPPTTDIDIINSRFRRTDPLYKHPMVPGYEGFMPNFKATNGQRFSVQATEGLAEFERQQLRNREAANQLNKVSTLQNDRGEPRNQEDRLT